MNRVVGAGIVVAATMIGAAWAALTALESAVADDDLRLPLVIAVVCVVVAIIAAGLVRRAAADLDGMPAAISLATVPALAGVALGALGAAAIGRGVVFRLVGIGIAVIAAVVAALRARMLWREFAETKAEQERIDFLRRYGRSIRATVVEAEHPGVIVDSQLLFHVTAEYASPSGTHRVQERMLVPLDGAPVAGGTVRLLVDSTDPQNVFMEPDPDSIKHPDPSSFLPAPGPETGGFGGGA